LVSNARPNARPNAPTVSAMHVKQLMHHSCSSIACLMH
jgi:hypothetical protein